jgi:dephospho-CoA kinase
MVIGVTGGYCTGKSEITQNLKHLGAKVIDLDDLAHSTLAENTATFRKIVKEFGKDILENRRINRCLLAGKVFGDRKKLDKLNSIIHPVVIKQMHECINRFRKKYKAIVVEAPLLFEAGLKKYFDYVILVKASKKNQLARAEKRNGLDRAEILRRIDSQWPLAKKVAGADFVIDNNKPIKEVHRQIKSVWDNLMSQ